MLQTFTSKDGVGAGKDLPVYVDKAKMMVFDTIFIGRVKCSVDVILHMFWFFLWEATCA